MAQQGHHFDLHKWEQRQRRQHGVQFIVVPDIEDADVRVLPGNAPQVAPGAGLLQFCSARFFYAL
jgi:hypothetical protein